MEFIVNGELMMRKILKIFKINATPARLEHLKENAKGHVMKILILEDEPIIAIDLEGIVLGKIDAEILHAATVADALDCLSEGLDFAMLDVVLGPCGETSLPIAQLLLSNNVPFCFISSSLDQLPAQLAAVPRITKPFRPHEVENLVPVHA